MCNINAKVAGMIYHSSGSSGGRHYDPTDNAITDVIITRASGNRSSRHGYLTNNARSSHSNHTNRTSTSGKPKTVYLGNK